MIGLLILAAPIAMAQEPPTTFRSDIKLIQVSVVAQDKKGQPVTDLRREDFQILDNGSPQEIRLFLAETEKPRPASIEPKAPNTFTNQIAPGGAHSGYSVILLDNLNTDFADLELAQDAALDRFTTGTGFAKMKVLQMLQSIPPGDEVALYALERRRLRIVQEFTTDRDSLERQFRAMKPSADTPRTGGRIFDEGGDSSDPFSKVNAAAVAHAVEGSTRIDARQRDSASDGEMEQLADHLAGIPGRKNLIWIANQFPLGGGALRRLNNAGVAIYPVSAMGICRINCPPNPEYTMNAIAAMTGGIAYHNRNDLDIAVREAVDDGRVSYTLGFYQSGDDRAPRVHQLAVRANRAAVTLRYRTSYETESARPGAADSRTDLVQALRRPIDATQVPIKASVKRTQDRLDLEATIDLEGLALTPDGDRWTGKVEIAARFTAVDESVVGEVFSQTLTLNLRQATYEKAMHDGGLDYHNVFKIPAKAVELKLLFASPASGKIGTLTIPLSEIAK